MEPTRRLTLLDGMIIVASTATGFALIRGSFWKMLEPPFPVRQTLIPWYVLDAGIFILQAWPLPALWTLAVLAVRLRASRPPWRRLCRHPGITACCAVVIVGLHNAVLLSCLSLLSFTIMSEALLLTALPVGLAVSATWANLVVSGRWRPQACPFDRAGRALGAFWIAVVPLHFAVLVMLFWR